MADSLISKRLEGIGEYYFSQKLRQIDQLRKEGHNILNLGIGSPDLKPPKQVEKMLLSGVSENGYHQYQPYKGLPELRSAFSGWYERYFNTSLDAGREILPLMGSKEGIMHSCMALLNEGDEVLVPDPGYPSYASASKLAGGIIRPYKLNKSINYLPDFDDLKMQNFSRVKLMWVNYPHMPTGADGSEALFEQLLNFSRRHHIIIINDNPYGFILTKERNSILKNRQPDDLVLELNSLSKSHNMAGWRVGMVGGNAELIQAMLTFKSNMDSGQFKPVMRAAIKALEMDEEWFTQLNAVYVKRRKRVFEVADLLGCSFDAEQVGMFVWAEIPQRALNGKAFADQLLKAYKIFVPPGSIFGPAGEKYIRFSLCSDLPVWNEVLGRIKK
ncbi:MAG: aminotransferase class I/II-fold pyridoxal phosphate-dependent enzyme [Ekhidna sp.]|nr:aminotransferase class I/II-fold pyridoxal phosphate-dependent enzyme [Ekhidna sp.]MBC6408969.1 aminotransferase class I/II-fold pyridoxal phosphate-dependent enzyme [Ekhidna sp.]